MTGGISSGGFLASAGPSCASRNARDYSAPKKRFPLSAVRSIALRYLFGPDGMTDLNPSATSRQLFASPESGLARVFWIAIALAGASAAYAAIGARDLVYDGSFYLLGIASQDGFQLFEPGRISVQLFQQCFVVAGVRLGIHDLWTLGRLFALGASGWPIVLTALCWFVLPCGE